MQHLTEDELESREEQEQASVLPTDQDNDDHLSLEERDSGVRWILWSNGFFFLGSVLYVWSSSKDLIDSYNYNEEDDDESSSSSDEDTDGLASLWITYKTISAAAALMYVGNSLVDLRVSLVEVRKDMTTSYRFGDDPHWEIGVAVVFGLAAVCEFIGVIIQNEDNPVPSYVAISAAVHLYLLNAIMVIWGRTPSFSSLSKGLLSYGDIFFVIGSIIDVVISYFDTPGVSTSLWRTFAWCGLASSSLWFIDSVLYILADMVSDDDVDYLQADSSDESDVDSELEFVSTLTSLSADLGAGLENQPVRRAHVIT